MVAFDIEKPSSSSPASSDGEKNERDVEDVALDKLGRLNTATTEASDGADEPRLGLHRTATFHFRAEDDELPQDWWFASTAIPLIAATSGPLANVCSIAALVTSWRARVQPGSQPIVRMSNAVGYPDPHWCIALNITSLIFGCLGNLFLLFNFTQRIRYIIALPATIICWYFATGLVSIPQSNLRRF
jgi:potassium channel subfamily K